MEAEIYVSGIGIGDRVPRHIFAHGTLEPKAPRGGTRSTGRRRVSACKPGALTRRVMGRWRVRVDCLTGFFGGGRLFFMKSSLLHRAMKRRLFLWQGDTLLARLRWSRDNEL